MDMRRGDITQASKAESGLASLQSGDVLKLLDSRSRSIFSIVVDYFLQTGSPLSSDNVVMRLDSRLSSATVRHVMSYLQRMGLLYAPHSSSGRLPTDAGLRLFVEGLLEVKSADENMRALIESNMAEADEGIASILEQASDVLSMMSHCTGVVMAPRRDLPIKHIEFVPLDGGKALAVIVGDHGETENRLISLSKSLTQSDLRSATNYLNDRLCGHTLKDMRLSIQQEIREHKAALDEASCRVVEAGLATWSGQSKDYLIVRGYSQLMEDMHALEDLNRIKSLFAHLESGRQLLDLVEMTQKAEGVRLFIGAESPVFRHAGCSMVVAPFRDQDETVVGAIGVVGPARMNYGHIIPMVDYTADLLRRIIAQEQ